MVERSLSMREVRGAYPASPAVSPTQVTILGPDKSHQPNLSPQNRRVGGLGTCRLTDDADIWTIARAAQLLTCRDPTVRNVCREQLHDTIRRGFRTEHPGVLPVGEYLSGSMDGVYRLRYAEAGSNLWTLARQAAKRLGVRIDVSGDENLRIVADDVSVSPVKAVRGLRKVARQRYTRNLLTDKSHQGVVAHCLSLEDNIERHGSPGILPYAPLLSRLEISSQRPARHPSSSGALVVLLSGAGYELSTMWEGKRDWLATKRHNTIQDLLETLLVKQGHDVTNKAIPGQRLRPDVEFQLSGSRVMVDVVVCYDQPGSMENAYLRKYDKYSSHGGFSPGYRVPLDHGTPGMKKFARYLESMDDPGVPFDSRPDWQQSRDQWKWCVPISIMVQQTPKLRKTPFSRRFPTPISSLLENTLEA
ncbi:hypothetical protein OUZ56_025723 [Daphnia magna]|uniref:Uncharacterized protein n=1 Tax=Daphnia magna TaxID=35525 RepID=A0ABQ9ZKB8_9CRUS|nr:hypothetical protein OUZ56_025723 [Daphnia magna]